MISVRIKQKNKTFGSHEKEFQIPSTWDEMTLQQFMAVVHTKEMTEIKLLSILTGLSEEYLTNVPEEKIFIAGAQMTLMLGVPNIDEWKLPTEVLIGETLYKVPKPEQMTFGQKVYLQEELNRVFAEEKPVTSCMPYAIAVYFYPIVTGDKTYTHEKITAFIPMVLRMRVTDAVPVANFFFRKFIASLPTNKKRSAWSQLRRKLMQELGTSKSSESQT